LGAPSPSNKKGRAQDKTASPVSREIFPGRRLKMDLVKTIFDGMVLVMGISFLALAILAMMDEAKKSTIEIRERPPTKKKRTKR
jgi:hypothetical protein